MRRFSDPGISRNTRAPPYYESFSELSSDSSFADLCKAVWGRGNHQKQTPRQLGFWGPPVGLETRHDEGSVLMRLRDTASVAVEAVWDDARWQLC